MAKPGGRVQVADIILIGAEVAPEGMWASGCAAEDVILDHMHAAGLVDCRLVGLTGFQTSDVTKGAYIAARKPLASAVPRDQPTATSVAPS